MSSVVYIFHKAITSPCGYEVQMYMLLFLSESPSFKLASYYTLRALFEKLGFTESAQVMYADSYSEYFCQSYLQFTCVLFWMDRRATCRKNVEKVLMTDKYSYSSKSERVLSAIE